MNTRQQLNEAYKRWNKMNTDIKKDNELNKLLKLPKKELALEIFNLRKEIYN